MPTTERELFEFCEWYYSLTKCEHKVFAYLMDTDYFEGNPRQLAEAIGYKGKQNATNVRKALLSLERKGVVCIVYTDQTEYDDNGNLLTKHNRFKACYIIDGWFNYIK